MQKPIAVAMAIFWNSLRSGLVQRFTKRIESLAKARPGSQNLTTLSMAGNTNFVAKNKEKTNNFRNSLNNYRDRQAYDK